MSAPVERLLSEVLRVVTALGSAAETTHGLASRDRKLVERLARGGGFVDVGDLARGLLQPIAEVARSAAELERAGWVEMRRDRFTSQVALTPRGRERWRTACDDERALYAWLGNEIDDHAVRSALATLRTVRRRLERDNYAQMPMCAADSATPVRTGFNRAHCA